MERYVQPADWIEELGWFSLAVAFASALLILADIVLRGHRQKMWIMNLVYPVTALYWGPVALWFYFTRGRRTSKPVVRERGMPDSDRLPQWVPSGSCPRPHSHSLARPSKPTSPWTSLSLGYRASSSSTSPSFPCTTLAGSRASVQP